jgi:hypothetical protein
VPAAVAAETVTVSADLPEAPDTVGGWKPQLAPLGNPEQESVTALLKPAMGASVIVEVGAPPATTGTGDNVEAETSNDALSTFSKTVKKGSPEVGSPPTARSSRLSKLKSAKANRIAPTPRGTP